MITVPFQNLWVVNCQTEKFTTEASPFAKALRRERWRHGKAKQKRRFH